MNRSRKWVVRVAAVAVSVGVLPAAYPSSAAADPVDDQRQRVEQITDELEALEERSDILAEDYVVAVDEKNRLDAEVVAAEQRVAEKAAEVNALRGELADVAVRAYMGAGSNG